MKREEAIAALRGYMPVIRRRPPARAEIALFGSTVREDAREDSDLDILLEFETDPTFLSYMGLKVFLEAHVGRKVDLATPERNESMAEHEHLPCKPRRAGARRHPREPRGGSVERVVHQQALNPVTRTPPSVIMTPTTIRIASRLAVHRPAYAAVTSRKTKTAPIL